MTLIGLDLDGTLEDSRDDMAGAVHRVRAELQLPPRKDAAIRPWVNQGMDQLYRACFDDYLRGSDACLSAVRTRYEADYFDHTACETTLYPGIVQSLEQLAALARLAVITNKPEHISRHLLKELGVDQFFATVIGGDTCDRSKPDRMVLEEAARRSGFDATPRQTLMIGDTTADMKLGRAFGATTIWCAWGYLSAPPDEHDYKANTPSELPTLVQLALQPN